MTDSSTCAIDSPSTWKPMLSIHPHAEALCLAASEYVMKLIRNAKQFEGRGGPTKRSFSIALSGGSTPKILYRILRDRYSSELISTADFAIHFFFGDVRMVPDDHADSNCKMVLENLFFSSLPQPAQENHSVAVPVLPLEQLHRVDTSSPPEEAAKAYTQLVLSICPPTTTTNAWPEFDLIFLGFGPDGHTASLFPGTAAAVEKMKVFTDCMPGVRVTPNVHRVTMTMPVIQAGRNVVVLATGADKKWVLQSIVGQAPVAGGGGETTADDALAKSPQELPVAAGLRLCRGTVTLFVDEACAP